MQKKNIKDLLGSLIEVDFRKCGGTPVISGTRIPIAMVVKLLKMGWDPKDILSEFDIPKEKLEKIIKNFDILNRFSEALSLIEIDKRKLRGMPVVRGTRVPAYYVYSLLKNGWSINELMDEFPTLRKCDIEALLKYRDVLEPFLERIYKKLTEKLHGDIGRVI